MGCNQCGACCKILTFVIPGLSNDRANQIYLKTHGCKIENETVIVPCPCPHLVDNKCDIHNRKPFICSSFKGQKKGFYIPKGCVYG